MADGISADNSELNALAADLGEVAATAGRYIRSAVEVSAMNVKKTWAAKAEGMAHAPAFPRSIDYDVSTFQGFGASVIQAEIGPNKDKPQGALGNLIEYGSVNNGPMGLGHAALQENQTDFESGLDKALADAERVLRGSSSILGSARGIIRGRF